MLHKCFLPLFYSVEKVYNHWYKGETQMISNFIKEIIDKKDIGEVENLTYLNKPIAGEGQDGIGISPYVDNVESAIRNGASLIAVVSQFGTGKSSIMEMLKKRYFGRETIDGIRYVREYHEVNMWSVLKQGEGNTGIELHKSFLYQLISSVDSTKGEYVSKRMSTNYGLFRLSLDSFGKACMGVGAVILWIVGVALKWAQPVILKWDLMSKTTVKALPIILMMVAFAMLIYVALRSEMVFSTKESEKRVRLIDENELIQLYRNYILQPIRWKKRLRKSKHYVVFVEDLDRSNSKEKIYNFLKELRKYYLADDASKQYRNRVTFVVNIMPESLLQDGGNIKCNEGFIYDKIFDYMVSLNRVNIDNYDSVLDQLILEKREELERIGLSVGANNNVHTIPGMQWIILGHNVSIRQVKARLNDAILTYHSIYTKFDVPNGKSFADFSRCAMVAYLRSEYPKDFYKLTDEDMKEIYEDFVRTIYETEGDAVDAWVESHNHLSKTFLKEIYGLMEKHLIDGNYRIYFNNYPMESHLYTVDEEWVRDIIIFDEYETFAGMEGELLKENNARLDKVLKDNSDAVAQALDDFFQRMGVLPNVAWVSVALWNHCMENREEQLLHTLTLYFEGQISVNDQCKIFIQSLMDRTQGVAMLGRALGQKTDKLLYDVRKLLITSYAERIQDVKALFVISGAPITTEELDEMGKIPIEKVVVLLPDDIAEVDVEVLKTLCHRLLDELQPDGLKKRAFFFERVALIYDTEEFNEPFIRYVRITKTYHHSIIKHLWERLRSGGISEGDMISVMNEIPPEQMMLDDFMALDEMDDVSQMNPALVTAIRQQGLVFAYARLILGEKYRRIDFTKDEIDKIINERLEWFFENQWEMFYRFRLWLCESMKNDILQYKALFFSPYPQILQDEIYNVTNLRIALQLFDVANWTDSTTETFAWYCNRKFRTSNEAFAIFQFLGRLLDEDTKSVFEQFNLQKVKFSGMSSGKKEVIVELLRNPLELDEPMNNIVFQQRVGCLVPALERELLEAMNGGTSQSREVERAYVKLVNGMGALSKATYGIISKMNTIYGYNDIVNEQLWMHKRYRYYVVSKIQWLGRFEIEHDKLEELWETYVGLLKTGDGFTSTRATMYKNREFLQMLMERHTYEELPEEGMLALAKIPQNPDVMKYVVDNYGSEVVISYFSTIMGFEDKTAAKAFVKLMKEYPKYAQVTDIYNNVHSKLVDGNLKGVYTKLYRQAN